MPWRASPTALTATIAGRRRALARAVHVLATDGLVTADRGDSWDRPLSATALLRITERDGGLPKQSCCVTRHLGGTATSTTSAASH